METIIVILIVAVAVWYLYRRIVCAVKADSPSCGCGGCGGCPAQPLKKNERDGPGI